MNNTKLKIATAAALSALLLGATPGFAGDDIGPDKAVQLMQAGTIKSFDALNEAALAKHPNATIRDTELEREYGKYVYKVELRDADGVEWDVDLDAATGEVLDDRRDD
jgi:uncharacterized membrane protein YkoI